MFFCIFDILKVNQIILTQLFYALQMLEILSF